MTVYGFALFVHVVLAIVLVGGSLLAHVTIAQLRRATTVEGARSFVAWLATFSRAASLLAVGVLVAGIYLAFAGRFWGAGWPAVSLVLFALAGAGAGAVVDPRVRAMQSELEEATTLSPAFATMLADPTLATVTWLMAGADLAVVFLMTNKPGWATSVSVAVGGLALGAVLGMREVRHLRAGTPTAGPAMPAA